MSLTIQAVAEETPRWRGCGAAAPYRKSTIVEYEPFTGIQLQASQQRINRDDEIIGIPAPRAEIQNGHRPSGSFQARLYPNSLLLFLLSCGHQPVAGYPKQGNGTNCVQTLTKGGTISGGTWTITFNGETTGAISATATAAEVQAHLERLASVRSGDIAVTGGPVTTTNLVLTFQGNYSAKVVPDVTVTTASLTGTTPTITPSVTTAGATGTNLDSLGRGAAPGAYIWELEARNGALGSRGKLDAFTLSLIAAYNEQEIFGEGFAVNRLSVSGDGGVSGDMVGLYVDRFLTTPTLSPVYDSETIRPVLFSDLKATWLSGGGPMSGFTWSVAHQHEVSDDASIRRPDWPARCLLSGRTELTGSMESSQFDAQDWDLMLAAGTFPLTADYVIPSMIAATGSPYRLTLYAPAAQLGADGGPEQMQNKARHGATWPWKATYSSSSGYAHRLIVHCARSAVETYV